MRNSNFCPPSHSFGFNQKGTRITLSKWKNRNAPECTRLDETYTYVTYFTAFASSAGKQINVGTTKRRRRVKLG